MPLSNFKLMRRPDASPTPRHHGGSGAVVIITPSYVKSFQILGDVLTRS